MAASLPRAARTGRSRQDAGRSPAPAPPPASVPPPPPMLETGTTDQLAAAAATAARSPPAAARCGRAPLLRPVPPPPRALIPRRPLTPLERDTVTYCLAIADEVDAVAMLAQPGENALRRAAAGLRAWVTELKRLVQERKMSPADQDELQEAIYRTIITATHAWRRQEEARGEPVVSSQCEHRAQQAECLRISLANAVAALCLKEACAELIVRGAGSLPSADRAAGLRERLVTLQRLRADARRGYVEATRAALAIRLDDAEGVSEVLRGARALSAGLQTATAAVSRLQQAAPPTAPAPAAPAAPATLAASALATHQLGLIQQIEAMRQRAGATDAALGAAGPQLQADRGQADRWTLGIFDDGEPEPDAAAGAPGGALAAPPRPAALLKLALRAYEAEAAPLREEIETAALPALGADEQTRDLLRRWRPVARTVAALHAQAVAYANAARALERAQRPATGSSPASGAADAGEEHWAAVGEVLAALGAAVNIAGAAALERALEPGVQSRPDLPGMIPALERAIDAAATLRRVPPARMVSHRWRGCGNTSVTALAAAVTALQTYLEHPAVAGGHASPARERALLRAIGELWGHAATKLARHPDPPAGKQQAYRALAAGIDALLEDIVRISCCQRGDGALLDAMRPLARLPWENTFAAARRHIESAAQGGHRQTLTSILALLGDGDGDGDGDGGARARLVRYDDYALLAAAAAADDDVSLRLLLDHLPAGELGRAAAARDARLIVALAVHGHREQMDRALESLPDDASRQRAVAFCIAGGALERAAAAGRLELIADLLDRLPTPAARARAIAGQAPPPRYEPVFTAARSGRLAVLAELLRWLDVELDVDGAAAAPNPRAALLQDRYQALFEAAASSGDREMLDAVARLAPSNTDLAAIVARPAPERNLPLPYAMVQILLGDDGHGAVTARLLGWLASDEVRLAALGDARDGMLGDRIRFGDEATVAELMTAFTTPVGRANFQALVATAARLPRKSRRPDM